MADRDFGRIAIVGRGLIGSSIELALRSRSAAIEVVALDRGDDLAAVAAAELVVLSAPILQNLQLLPLVSAHAAPGTLITDTGSTKRAIVEAAADRRFIGGHPIAGAAGGREAARADLFAGRPWILTPTANCREEDLTALTRFVEGLGATAQVLAPDDHDRIFALVSHLPQLVVSTLMDVIGSHVGEQGLGLAGSGLRDSTRLASSPPEIWRDILETNRDNIAQAVDGLISGLTSLQHDTEGKRLQSIFEGAARWKRILEKAPDLKGGR